MIFTEAVYCCKNRFAVAMWVPHPRQAGEGSRRKCRGRGSGRPTCVAGGARRKRRPVAGPGVGQTWVLGKQKGHSGEKSVRVLRVDGAGALGDRRCRGLGPPRVWGSVRKARRFEKRSHTVKFTTGSPRERAFRKYGLENRSPGNHILQQNEALRKPQRKKKIIIMHEAESSRTLY